MKIIEARWYTAVLPTAVAMRPVRIKPKTNRIITYTATTFVTQHKASAIDQLIRMLGSSRLGKEETKGDDRFVLDILDAEGDIIQEYILNRQGFKYLRMKLKFTVEVEDDNS